MFLTSTCFRRAPVTIHFAHHSFRKFTFTAEIMAPKRKKHERSNSTEDPALKRPSTKRAKEIDESPPYDQLEDILEHNNSDVKPRNVLHWFRSKDLRQEDNPSLHAAYEKAKEGNGHLITMYLHSPKDLEWHGLAPVRVDFMLETVGILQKQLEEKHIPLSIIEAAERAQKTEKVMKFVADNDISHIYANMEYEVDELRRDISVAKQVQEQKDLSFEVLHDQTVVIPGELKGQGGGPIKVFTPYHGAWLKETKSNPELFEDTGAPPETNDKQAAQDLKALFGSKIPKIEDLPESRQFASKEERERLRKLWPAGHDAGMERLSNFLNKKVMLYQLV